MPTSSVAALDLFLPPVREWFATALGQPTPAQEKGWPSIAAGQNTLILAPTGSGKTLAAFLACLDHLWRQEHPAAGVQVLYISPLKALNNDIHRNLQAPLDGVAEVARRMQFRLPEIDSAVRTGDTPPAERQRLLRHPPHVLITTPESLHLMLTSRARDTLRHVKYCIVDEIHALCTNKRGVFLALLLERLAALNPADFVRIGLSATQRPLDEVARYLGGQEWTSDGTLQSRPVTVIDAGLRKELDLKVVSPVEQFGALPEKTIWPSIYRLLYREITQHRSTIIFANNRRSVERITAHLNAAAEDGSQESGVRSQESESTTLAADSLPLVRAHHGSVALDVRQATEEALKEGRLAAVVATASLELGIDMGAVELVCQVESPGNVARGLQRVGRAGHLVGRASKGRLIPKTLGDLLEQAVLAREMMAGHVEACRVPVNCLDILAQQIVAMTAVDAWSVPKLLARVRQAYPFRDLAPAALEAVLEMISGRFRFEPEASPQAVAQRRPGQTLNALQPRVSWDRVHNRLHALPGSQHLALVHGGTIPDTGQFAVYTTGGVRIGEIDEEFTYERRVGESFVLGTNTWHIEQIGTDRVIVSPNEGAHAVMPFWRGEQAGRTYDLGLAIGRFLRDVDQRLEGDDCQSWLRENFHLDAAAARNLRQHVLRQRLATGTLPTDQTLCVEAFRDPLGDWQVILLCPLGNKVNLGLRLAIENRLKQRLGYRPQCLHHDDGVLVRLTDSEEPVLDLLQGISADNVSALIVAELADTPLFAIRFRHNASRALLLPTGGAGKRAPLWLQRLRGKDLLQVARQHPDFPIVVETYRECLQDYLDVPHLQEVLGRVAVGEVKIATRRADGPSPFAAGMLFAFTAAYMYQYDDAEATASAGAALDQHLLEQLLSPQQQQHLLDPRAVRQVNMRLRGVGRPPRSTAETAEWLRRLGDLTPTELEGPLPAYLEELQREGRALQLDLPHAAQNPRWLLAEEEPLYRRAFGIEEAALSEQQQAAETILLRFLNTHALVSLADILERYPFDADWARGKLEQWAHTGRLVPVPATTAAEPMQWSAPENLERVARSSLGLLRREVVTAPPHQFADFELRWQRLHPQAQREQTGGLREVLENLEGLLLPAELWEQVLLPARVPEYQPRWLDDLLGGEWTWFCRGEGDSGPGQLAFVQRENIGNLPPPPFADMVLQPAAERVLECLRGVGASFVLDISQHTGLTPGAVRAALWRLLRQGIVTNDRFDVIRRGEPPAHAPDAAAAVRRSSVRRGSAPPEGRWSLLPWGSPTAEAQAIFAAWLLLARHGVAARELAQMDAALPPWRVLYEVLSRMELAGDVRRGYFAEGLSGAQFALPEAARLLAESAPPVTNAPVLLIHSLDPANLYGSGAPFDIPLLDGGTRPFLRRPGNWLVLSVGRPVLLIEQQGARLTALPSAVDEVLRAAVKLLPRLLQLDRVVAGRHKLTVTEWNSSPVIGSTGQLLLEQAGFVRDYQALTLYAGWGQASG